MRHLRSGRKLNRSSSHRRALLRNLATALFLHERISTTEAKAKELKRLADKMVTLGKKGSLDARRRALRVLYDKTVVKKLFDELATRYRERPGGYTRVIKLGTRDGDNAEMALIELVDAPPQDKK